MPPSPPAAGGGSDAGSGAVFEPGPRVRVGIRIRVRARGRGFATRLRPGHVRPPLAEPRFEDDPGRDRVVDLVPAPGPRATERAPPGELGPRLHGGQPLVGGVHREPEPAPEGVPEAPRAPGHGLGPAVHVERLPDHQPIRLPGRDDPVDGVPVRLPAAHVHRRERACGSGDGLPHRHPDAALAVVEPEEGPAHAHARPDCPDRRCISIPSPRAASSQRSSNGASKTRSRSAGPLSHAFCRTSFSSCPGPHPA